MKPKRRIAVESATFKHRLICLAVASAFGGVVHANPTGPAVVNGQAAFSQQGNTLAITNSPNAIINWQSFSIGATEATRFIQHSASSAVLNRVIGVDPSVILGTLQSNGKVFLINPSGVLFGHGSRIDVAGLVASTLNMSDKDFLAGRLNFTAGSITAGGLTNRGTITTPSGGSVILVAPQIENSGIINAPNGDVILAAGHSVRLGDTGAPNVLVEIQAPDTQAINVGEIIVGGGSASIYAGLIQQKGIVRAEGASMDAAGRIVFKATKDVTLAAGSTTSASGAKGGDVLIQAESGTNLVYGEVSAIGYAGKGGGIQLLGNQVGAVDSSVVTASGASGGGVILVGGDYKGDNLAVQIARATYFGAGASLISDATVAGDGGRIILWSNEATRAYGSISAKGGATSGKGGFVETSSRGYLDVTRGPELGSGGTWLIDPFDIVVSNVNGQLTNNSGAPNFTPTGNTSTIGANLIGGQLSTGASVTLDTTGAGSQAGNIVVQGSILTSNAVPTNLTLRAHNNIYLQPGSKIESSVAALNVTLNSDQDASGAGAVSLNGSSIITNGGNLVIGGGANPLTDFARLAADGTYGSLGSGVSMFNSTISTGAGNITINGASNAVAGLTGDGILVSSGTIIQSTTGNVLIRGDAASLSGNVNFASGVRVDFDGRILSDTGAIHIIGTGAGTPGSPATAGTGGVVVQKDALIRVGGAGRIELEGTGGASSSATNSVEGVTLLDRAHIFADNGGTIIITGSPGTPIAGGAIQNGVGFNSDGSAPGVTVRAGGAGGSITITGLAGNGTVVENANGVAMQGAGTLVEATGAATITINGTGSNTSLVNGWAGTNGLLMFGGAQIRSAAGAITITGTGGLTTPTASGAIGVNIFDSGTAVTTSNGTIQITGAGGGTLTNPTGQSAHGVLVGSGARVQATGAGSVTITGTAGFAAGVTQPNGTLSASSSGIDIQSGGAVSTVSGAIDLDGKAGTTAKLADGSWGVSLFGGSGDAAPITGIFSTSGNITVSATGPGTVAQRSGSNNGGVFLYQRASIETGAAGNITINGNAGAGSGGFLQGVLLWGGATPADANHPTVKVENGTIAITGVGGNTDNTDTPWPGQTNSVNDGIEFASGGQVVVTGAVGHIELTGTGGNAGQGGNNGITVYSAGTGDPVTGVFATGGGTIAMTGTANGPSNYGNGSHGIFVSGGRSQVQSTAAITLTGFGIANGVGSQNSDGVAMLSGASIVTTASGAIQITGTGGGTLANPLDQSGHGVALQSGAVVQATGTGSVSITGTSGVTAGIFDPNNLHVFTAGAISSYSNGVDIDSFGSVNGSKILTNTGSITWPTLVGRNRVVLIVMR